MQQALNYYAMGVWMIYRLLLLHSLWLAFTIFGLVIFGFFPATYALFETLKEPTDLNTKEYVILFINRYKSVFIKINLAAIIWQVMLTLMATNLLIFYKGNLYVLIPIVGALLLMLLCIIYFIERFTMEMKILQQMKRSLGYVFLYPKRNILFMGMLLLLLLAINFSPGITLFFGGSVIAQLIVKVMAI